MASRTSIEWSIDKFNKFLVNFQQSTGITAELVLKKYATEALSRIIQRTPVDTGRARYGWSTAAKALGLSVPKPRAGTANLDPGFYEEKLDGRYKFIRFANHVPYAIYLEYGWSKQAPLGMVRITMAELRGGIDISRELMDELKAAWEQTPGRLRYTANRRMMSGVLAAVKDAPLTRKAKPTLQRRR
jgi:hypothetical protein